MLRTKFWRSLYSTELRNATRVYFEQIKEFELLRRKVRGEEYEILTHKTTAQKQMVPERIKKQVECSADLDRLKEIQHQPIQLDDSTKMIKELTRRLENVEKKLAYRRPTYRQDRSSKIINRNNEKQTGTKGDKPREDRNTDDTKEKKS